MGNKTIHLTQESENVLNKIKAKTPGFNFSSFVTDALNGITQGEVSEEAIIKILNQAKLDKQKAEQDIERAERLLKRFKENYVQKVEIVRKKTEEVEAQKERGTYGLMQKIEKDQELRRSGEIFESAQP